MEDRNKIFVSYSHRDVRWLDRLRVHLRPLERNHTIEIWDDTRITPGADWRAAIADAIESAKIGILLVSADFLASDFIVNNEIPPLLEAAKNRGSTILCVITNPCRFEKTTELSQFQAINNPARPLSKLPVAEREAVWVKVADAVEACFEGRKVTEGWLVRNERILFEALRKLVHQGSELGFLIAVVGHYYVQFAFQGNKEKLYVEAVSDAFLPENLQLTKKAADLLIMMGFKEPVDEISNYHRTYPIDEDDAALLDAARKAIKVMASVYRVSERSDVEIKLDLVG